MSGDNKVAVAGGVTVMALLTLLVSSQGLEFVRFAFGELKGIAGLPLFAPVVMAVIVGAVAPAWLPYWLPPTWARSTTLRVTRSMASAIAFLMVLGQYRSAIGLQYALFAATGAYVLWTIASNVIYARYPSLKPPSLIDEDVFCEHVRQVALAEGRRQALAETLAKLEHSAADPAALIVGIRIELAKKTAPGQQ